MTEQGMSGLIAELESLPDAQYRDRVQPRCIRRSDVLAIVRKHMEAKPLGACRKCDLEMERVKACEQIAEGDMEGNDWRILRDICPSTMAVADLRDKYEALLALTSQDSPQIAEQAIEAGIPSGWHLHTADFSLNPGRVMLKRDKDGEAWWFSLTSEQREHVDLYVTGTGSTLAEAIADAAKVVAYQESGGANG